jgi:hypothetical protein
MPKAEDRVVDLDCLGVGHGDYLETGREIRKDVNFVGRVVS